MLEQLNHTDFLPYLHTTFTIQLQGIEPIELELDKVTPLPVESRGPIQRQPFSLIFLGPKSTQYLLQHIYTIEHPQMGMLDLFIVPLGLLEGRMQYEVIFT